MVVRHEFLTVTFRASTSGRSRMEERRAALVGASMVRVIL
jgi:hypothetical protein